MKLVTLKAALAVGMAALLLLSGSLSHHAWADESDLFLDSPPDRSWKFWNWMELQSLGTNTSMEWYAPPIYQIYLSQAISRWDNQGGLRYDLSFSAVGSQAAADLFVVDGSCQYNLACVAPVTYLYDPVPDVYYASKYRIKVDNGFWGANTDPESRYSLLTHEVGHVLGLEELHPVGQCSGTNNTIMDAFTGNPLRGCDGGTPTASDVSWHNLYYENADADYVYIQNALCGGTDPCFEWRDDSWADVIMLSYWYYSYGSGWTYFDSTARVHDIGVHQLLETRAIVNSIQPSNYGFNQKTFFLECTQPAISYTGSGQFGEFHCANAGVEWNP